MTPKPQPARQADVPSVIAHIFRPKPVIRMLPEAPASGILAELAELRRH